MFTQHTAGSWTQSGDSEESDGETDSMASELKSYYKAIAVQGALEEQIAGIMIEQRQSSNTIHYLKGQEDGSAVDSDLSTRLTRLKQDLLDSRKSSEQLREACIGLGIDVEQRRWRENPRGKSSLLGKAEPPEARLRGWLDNIEDTEHGAADKDVSYLSCSRLNVIQPVR
jgi:hypothetical protein